MGWKSHNGVKTSVDFFDFRHAEPFLHAVASCFIERLATGDVIGIINSGDWYENDALEIVNNCFLSKKRVSPSDREIAGQARNEGIVALG